MSPPLPAEDAPSGGSDDRQGEGDLGGHHGRRRSPGPRHGRSPWQHEIESEDPVPYGGQGFAGRQKQRTAIKKEAFSLNEVPSAIRLASHDRCTSPAPLSHEDGAGIETRHDNCKIGPVEPVWKLLLSMSGTVYHPPSVDLRILDVRCCHLSTSIHPDTSACDGSDA